MILLDTNICVRILRGDQSVLAHYLQHAGNIAISFMTVGELYSGVEKSPRPKENRKLIEEFLSVVPIVHSSDGVMRRFGALKAQVAGKGRIVEDADVMIAATALEMNAPLATGNVKHMSRFDGLEIRSWE